MSQFIYHDIKTYTKFNRDKKTHKLWNKELNRIFPDIELARRQLNILVIAYYQ